MDAPINVDTLAQSIAETPPCGEDLREDPGFDSPYQTLKSLRDEAMDMERGDRSAVGDDSAQDSGQALSKWVQVVSQAEKILSENSKDIEVCALFLEGLVRTAGLEGLACGLELTARLVEDYWEELHPRLDPDDPDSIEDRVAAFNGVNGTGQPGTVARYLPRLPVVESSDYVFFAYQIEQAFTAEAAAKADDSGSISSGLDFTSGDLERAAQATPLAFYTSFRDALDACEANLERMDTAFTDKCGANAPSTGMIRGALESLRGNLGYLAGDRLEAAELTSEEEVADAEATEAADGLVPRNTTAAGPLQSRAQAIEQLRKVARYFRETEPHSPLSYSLDNIVRWAGMPLDKLVDEWITDESARERYRLITGMGHRSEEDGQV
ncbi:MAG: type VI secretion system protein TssA [Pseudomonadota bacterium]